MQTANELMPPEGELEFRAMRAGGPGGQNVNKVSSAIHLFFDIRASSLPEQIKQRLLALQDRRITAEGTVVIKAMRHRTQEQNKEDARHRLLELIAKVSRPPKKRKPTRPTLAAREKRLQAKATQGRRKALRRPVNSE